LKIIMSIEKKKTSPGDDFQHCIF